jgi:hypothetical protein
MAHALTFDTLAFVKKLEKAGIEPEKSEAITEAIADVFENNLSTNVFTKQDNEVFKHDIENKLSKLETKIITWVIGLFFAQTAILVSLTKFTH